MSVIGLQGSNKRFFGLSGWWLGYFYLNGEVVILSILNFKY
jgi:hypothetical protein